MKIEMLKTTNGSNDGKFTETFEAGQTYNVSEDLAKCFLAMNVAKEIKKESTLPPLSIDSKAITGKNYQNKAVKPKLTKED